MFMKGLFVGMLLFLLICMILFRWLFSVWVFCIWLKCLFRFSISWLLGILMMW